MAGNNKQAGKDAGGNYAAEAAAAIVQKIDIRSADRARKDMLTLRNAVLAAESVSMPCRSRLYDLYTDMQLDAFLSGLVTKRINTVLNKKLVYRAGDSGAGMSPLLDSLRFRDLKKELLLSIFWGITGVEFIPGDVFDFNIIPRKHIRPSSRIISYRQDGLEGVSYDDFWNIWVLGDPAGLGLFLPAAYYVLLKRGAISDWAEYIETFGRPIEKLKYKGYDEQSRAEGRKILDGRGVTTKMLVPDTLDYEIIEPKTSGNSGALQDGFRRMANEEMSVLILGVTETTSSSAGSGYAQSIVHSAQQQEIIKDDMNWLLGTLNSRHFFNVLRSYGLPVSAGGRFYFGSEVDIDFLERKAKIDIDLVQKAGLSVSPAYFYDTYGIPPPLADG